MNPFVTTQNKRPGLCCVRGCRGKVTARQRKKQGRFCRRCKEDRYKATHPYAYSLNKLRNNARRRGIPFDLTLEEWIMFCDLTGYVDARGRGAEDLTVDRIRSGEGYTLNNIRALTNRKNGRKGYIEKKLQKLRERARLLSKHAA